MNSRNAVENPERERNHLLKHFNAKGTHTKMVLYDQPHIDK